MKTLKKKFSGIKKVIPGLTVSYICLLVLLNTSSFAYQNEPETVFGFKWGATPEELKDDIVPYNVSSQVSQDGGQTYESLFPKKGFKAYRLKRKVNLMGFTAVPFLMFRNNKLAEISMTFYGPAGYTTLRSKMFDHHGKPDRSFTNKKEYFSLGPLNPYIDMHEWYGKTNIELGYREYKRIDEKPEDRISYYVKFISREHYYSNAERIDNALYFIQRDMCDFFGSLSYEQSVERKKRFMETLTKNTAKINNSLDKIKASNPQASEAVESFRSLFMNEFHSLLAQTVKDFENLPPGNPDPDQKLYEKVMENSFKLIAYFTRFKKELDKLESVEN